jgi:hypothetical protein
MAPTVSPAPSATGSSADDTLFGVPKWALAVAAGGVVVAGVAYYILSSPSGASLAKKSTLSKDGI